MLNKILSWYINIRKDITVKKLKKKNITDIKVVYYKNKDFQEEVLIDHNMNPHYTTTYFKAMNINANMFQPNNFDIYQNKIESINSEINELKTKEKPIGISIKIKRARNDNHS